MYISDLNGMHKHDINSVKISCKKIITLKYRKKINILYHKYDFEK